MRRLSSFKPFTRPNIGAAVKFWDGAAWRDERRTAVDHRVGRRRTDVWFPYNAGFVAQVIGQSTGAAKVFPAQHYCGAESTVAQHRYSFDA